MKTLPKDLKSLELTGPFLYEFCCLFLQLLIFPGAFSIISAWLYPLSYGFIAHIFILLSLEECYVKLLFLPSSYNNLKVDCAPGLNMLTMTLNSLWIIVWFSGKHLRAMFSFYVWIHFFTYLHISRERWMPGMGKKEILLRNCSILFFKVASRNALF